MINKIDFLKPKFPKFFYVKNYFASMYKKLIFSNDGPHVKALEKRMKDMFEYDGQVIACANGTLALMVALKASDVKKVLLPSFTFPATLQAIEWCGIEYDFVDIDQDTWTIDIKDLEDKIISFKPDAIIPVHSFGNPCDVKSIDRLSSIHNIKVIYDAAPAISSFVNLDDNNIHISHFGDICCFSLHATKVVPAGEGGMIFCKDEGVAEKIRLMINFSLDGSKDVVYNFGINAKMSEAHASFALPSLNQLAFYQKDRIKLIDRYYNSELKDNVIFQKIENKNISSYQVFSVLLRKEDSKNRDDMIQDMLDTYGVECRKYYNPPLHKTKVYKKDISLPTTEDICARIITLPLHLWLKDFDIDYVVKSFIKSFEAWRK